MDDRAGGGLDTGKKVWAYYHFFEAAFAGFRRKYWLGAC